MAGSTIDKAVSTVTMLSTVGTKSKIDKLNSSMQDMNSSVSSAIDDLGGQLRATRAQNAETAALLSHDLQRISLLLHDVVSTNKDIERALALQHKNHAELLDVNQNQLEMMKVERAEKRMEKLSKETYFQLNKHLEEAQHLSDVFSKYVVLKRLDNALRTSGIESEHFSEIADKQMFHDFRKSLADQIELNYTKLPDSLFSDAKIALDVDRNFLSANHYYDMSKQLKELLQLKVDIPVAKREATQIRRLQLSLAAIGILILLAAYWAIKVMKFGNPSDFLLVTAIVLLVLSSLVFQVAKSINKKLIRIDVLDLDNKINNLKRNLNEAESSLVDGPHTKLLNDIDASSKEYGTQRKAILDALASRYGFTSFPEYKSTLEEIGVAG